MSKPPAFPLYPWFGGKARVAEAIWARFGDVGNYIEPFYGGGAVHLLRPHWDWRRGKWHDDQERRETINDADGMIANFWRAMQSDPGAVARWADWPVNEADLHARHLWLKRARIDLAERLMADPDWYDAKIAGWWLWGIGQWIGNGFTVADGPWAAVDGRLVNIVGDDDEIGITRRIPKIGRGSTGIYKVGIARAAGASFGMCERHTQALFAIMRAYADRLRRVHVCCGNWTRVVKSNTVLKASVPTALFFDPPYPAEAGRDEDIYAEEDLAVSHAAYEWCLEHGDDPDLRIAFCSYDGVYEFPDSWETYRWRARGGYSALGNGTGRLNRTREVIYFSPHCLRQPMQVALWERLP